MYKPLPDNLTIGASNIHDHGIFAKEDIPEQNNLGATHLELGRLILRTPLGGFINHSDKPNCLRSQVRIKPHYDKWTITVVEDIEEGEELTLKYTMYDPQK